MKETIYKVGFWSGILAFASTVAFFIVQLLQLVRVFTFPLDEILIYGFSLGIVIPFILEMLALHYTLSDEKKFWTHAALIFTIIYAVFVVSNYVVQLATVIPFTLRGAGSEVAILKQTPHSLFWDYDAIGYISMGLATLFALPAFEKNGFQKWVRNAFLIHTLATPLIAFVYFYQGFSETILLIGLPWAITAPLFMLMLAIMFKKESVILERRTQ